MHLNGSWRDRFLYIGYLRQFFVLYFDEIQSGFRNRWVFGHDRGDRITDVSDLVDRDN
jgi:hypothetical protein